VPTPSTPYPQTVEEAADRMDLASVQYRRRGNDLAADALTESVSRLRSGLAPHEAAIRDAARAEERERIVGVIQAKRDEWARLLAECDPGSGSADVIGNGMGAADTILAALRTPPAATEAGTGTGGLRRIGWTQETIEAEEFDCPGCDCDAAPGEECKDGCAGCAPDKTLDGKPYCTCGDEIRPGHASWLLQCENCLASLDDAITMPCPTPPPPDAGGRRCGTCGHADRCTWLLGPSFKADSVKCDWEPSRWTPRQSAGEEGR
jgi:hypothetical protein